MAYKIGYYIGFFIGFIKNLINERMEMRKPKCPAELHPCPFCGCEPIYREFLFRGHIIWCENPDCPIKPKTMDYGTFELAEKAWNTRAEK